ncbi:MAG: hypothetical protein ACRC8Y_23385 [Chroococcales cyanobacterium]
MFFTFLRYLTPPLDAETPPNPFSFDYSVLYRAIAGYPQSGWEPPSFQVSPSQGDLIRCASTPNRLWVVLNFPVFRIFPHLF